MKKNLDIDHFQNGDLIIEAKTENQWLDAAINQIPAWCFYENNAVHGKISCKLCNWYAVSDPRGLAPTGYRIPKDSEWQDLIDYLNGDKAATLKLKSNFGWLEGTGTNEIGFTCLPGGFRSQDGKIFQGLGYSTFLWSATLDLGIVWCRAFFSSIDAVKRLEAKKGGGFSIRCLKNN